VLAERKSHAELRVELGEFLQAGELVLASSPGPDVERDAELMMGDVPDDNALALPPKTSPAANDNLPETTTATSTGS
jgi:hypothetical protein